MESGENKKKSSSSNSFVSAKKKCIKFCSNKHSRNGYEKLRQSPSPPPSPKYYNKSTQTEPEKKSKQKDLIEL